MADHPVIEVCGVWKIFGSRAEESLNAVNREGIGKPEELERFGCETPALNAAAPPMS